jgi:putative ABC transport system permease protein
MRNYDLGMTTERVIVVNGYGFQAYTEYLNFKRIAESAPAVTSVGYATAAPGDDIMMLGLRPRLGVRGNDASAEVKLISVDESLFKTLGIRLLAGRQFESGNIGDSTAVMLNVEAAKLLGYADLNSIIGQTIDGSKDKDIIAGTIGAVKVVGVVADFHQRSLRNPLDPMIFVPSWNLDLGWNKRYYFIKVNGDDKEQSAAVALIRDAWIQSSPSHPFSYYFLETSIAQQYRYENDVAGLFVLFSCLAVFISALGLFGLIAFITISRTKEIGIRKVLGASVSSILTLLSGNIVKMLVVATAIALPVSWYTISRWIERYAFRIEIGPLLFIWPVLCVFVIAITTVVLRSLRTARDNPVNSLRQE